MIDIYIKSIKEIFSPKFLWVHALFIVLTTIIVISGADWKYFLWVKDTSYASLWWGGVGMGTVVPMVVVPVLLISTFFLSNQKWYPVVKVAFIAESLGWVISSIYKAFTGRVEPPRDVIDPLVDMSRNWNFGFLEHGIFWGWPSSHTTVMFALCTSLMYTYRRNKIILCALIIAALYVGISTTIRIHWLSEFISGAILGVLIGLIVGKVAHISR